MKILAVGDIVGESGVKKLKEELPKIKKEKNIDFVITNGENSAGGMGLNEKNFKDIMEAGTNVVTMGNHTWGKKDIFKFIDNPNLLRPANYPKGVVGKGLGIYECKGKKIAVMNFLGRVDLNILTENPFVLVKEMVEEIKDEVDMIFIDFHAEATSEKLAMAYFLDGKVSAVFGTHTHVQTADEVILPKGTGNITDLGMTGPQISILGRENNAIIKKFITGMPQKFEIANGKGQFCGCIFDIDEQSGLCTDIERIFIREK